MKTRLHKGYIQQICEAIGGIVGISLEILIGFLLLISRLLFRFRTWLYRLAIVVFILSNAYTTFMNFADAPKAQAAHTTPYVADRPAQPTQEEQIKAYIRQVFGDQADNAFKVLACENHSLNPDAVGHNTNGTTDTGIFQINSLWANPAVLTDWKTNIDMAHVIYLRGGWHEWSCESVWHALERNDTI